MELIHLKHISVSDRQRKFFPLDKIIELAEDNKRNGLLHAPVLQADSLELLAGERRCRAVEMIYDTGGQFMYGGELIPPGLIPITRAHSRDAIGWMEAELENIARQDLTWQERAQAMLRLDDLRKMQNPGHTSADTLAEWTRERLRETLTRTLHGERVVVLANREPYVHERLGDKIEVLHPASGMVTALEPVMRACSGVWIAHGSGSADRETSDAKGRVWVPPGERLYTTRRNWLTPEEEATFQPQLDGIVGYVRQIGQADLSGVEPMAHAVRIRNVFREDATRPGLDHDTVMANAPAAIEEQFQVPKIVE